MNILVSACLLGVNCKYSGGNNLAVGLEEALTERGYTIVPVCPECMGGLPTPRVPAERVGERVVNKVGEDVTPQFRKGAQAALEAALEHGCTVGILKKNSPSCGCGDIYDGTFTGTLVDGDGVTAELLKEHGIAVYNEDTYGRLLRPWVVTYDDGIWNNAPDGDDMGAELSVNARFRWAERDWVIPSVYVCRQGLVMDVCQSAEREDLQAFIDKWNLLENDGRDVFTDEQREQIERENPLGFGYNACITVNGREIRQKSASGVTWNPCVLGLFRDMEEQRYILRHYGLDESLGWSLRRVCFPWGEEGVPDIETLSVTLTGEKQDYTAGCFTAAAGDAVTVTHPMTGEEFTLTVLEVEPSTLDVSRFPEEDIIYPQCYTAMTYTVTPPIDRQRLQLRDTCRGDSPIRKGKPNGSMGMAILVRNEPDRTTAVSSLTFEPRETVEWRAVFHESVYAPISVELMK